MPTIRLVPSTYTRSSTNRVTVSNADNMYNNTDHTASYATLRGRNNSSSTYYCFIHGFDFSQVPTNATISSFTVKIRCYRSSNQRTGSTYNLRLASSPSSSSVISGTTTSTAIDTTASIITIPTGNLTWNTLKNYGTNFSIDVVLASSSNSYPYVYVYGAEIEVTYTAETVHPTSVSVNPSTASVEAGSTVQLTETVLPANATDKSVSWSSSNTSVATVNSSGLVTSVSAGSATITVTTVDGSYTATCAITVTPAVLTDYILTNTLEPGKEYLIVNGNSGSVYMMSNEAGTSRTLKGIATTVSNNKISINGATAAKVTFGCELYDSNNSITTSLINNNQYIYSDSGTGLRMYTSASMNRFWHYVDNKFWLFKSTSTNGYTDTSSEYKYYLEWDNSGNFTDNHLTSPSVQNTAIPTIYLFVKDNGTVEPTLSFKSGTTTWTTVTKVWVKTGASTWTQQSSISNVFDSTTNYIKGN